MNMTEWAEREVELACKRENPSRKPGEWDYGCACYESALKAFKSLMEDEHSGFSIGVTKNILVRLIEGKALTPIEDTVDIWEECLWQKKDKTYREYQCSRMNSLFKELYPDGTVKYKDVQRTRVTYANNPSITWSNGMASGIIDEMFPITMPYIPETRPYVVHAEEFLVDPTKGDYDTLGYLFVVKPDGEKVVLNRYFKEGDHYDWIEIDSAEYYERKLAAHDLQRKV